MQTVYPSNYSNDISFAKLWWTYFKCSLPHPNCTTLKNCPIKALFKWFSVSSLGMSMSETCYNLYNSVYAVAHSLHEMTLQQTQFYSHQISEKNAYPWEVISPALNFNYSTVLYGVLINCSTCYNTF